MKKDSIDLSTVVLKEYSALDAFLKGLWFLLWAVIVLFYFGLAFITIQGEVISPIYALIYGAIAIPAFALLFALLQFFEAVVDIAKNTNINSLLLRKQLENK